MTGRYFVSKEHLEHSCCYDVCIKDREMPLLRRKGDFYSICECKDEAIAERIVEFLNRDVS